MALWTKEHAQTLLPSVAVMLIIALLLGKLLAKKDWRIRMIPFQAVACLLFVLEVGKQVLSLMEGYDLYHLPFHFCSLFIFIMPIMAFYRGKHQGAVGAITSAICTSVFLLMMIYPSLIYSDANIREFFTNFFSFHTVAFHNLILLGLMLILTLRLHTPAPNSECKVVMIFIICFCVISASMAQLLQTNFNNFYSCNVPPLEDLRIQIQGILGYGFTQALYVLIVTVLDICFVSGSYWLYRLLKTVFTKKERVA